jgi:hypothetical protein
MNLRRLKHTQERDNPTPNRYWATISVLFIVLHRFPIMQYCRGFSVLVSTSVHKTQRARALGRQNFALWLLIFLDPQYKSCCCQRSVRKNFDLSSRFLVRPWVSSFCQTALLRSFHLALDEVWMHYETLDFWHCTTSCYLASDSVNEHWNGEFPWYPVVAVHIEFTDKRYAGTTLALAFVVRLLRCQWEHFNFLYFGLFSLHWITHQFIGFHHVIFASLSPRMLYKTPIDKRRLDGTTFFFFPAQQNGDILT